MQRRVAENKAIYKESKDYSALVAWAYLEYVISVHFLGENSLANAKKLGALDAKELYPDIVQTPFKEFAKAFYGKGAVQ